MTQVFTNLFDVSITAFLGMSLPIKSRYCLYSLALPVALLVVSSSVPAKMSCVFNSTIGTLGNPLFLVKARMQVCRGYELD
jgi:hypothetical protein